MRQKEVKILRDVFVEKQRFILGLINKPVDFIPFKFPTYKIDIRELHRPVARI